MLNLLVTLLYFEIQIRFPLIIVLFLKVIPFILIPSSKRLDHETEIYSLQRETTKYPTGLRFSFLALRPKIKS